jgi:hypothetical protein
MENCWRAKMDSKAWVCYMNFGVGGYLFTESAFLEEHWFAF